MKSAFRILQSNAENGFYLREIRPQGGFQLRNLVPDFMDFFFTVRLRNQKRICKTVLVNSGLLFANYACVCRTVFQILLPISQSNGKNENPKTAISALKSVFGFRVPLQIRNPDFKIYIQISQSNAPSIKIV